MRIQQADFMARVFTRKFSSVQLSYSVISDSLWSHELQHARPLCPSPIPRVHSNSYTWVGDAIQSSHPLLSNSPLAFNLSSLRVFRMSQLFAWGGQSIGASASFLPMNIQDRFPLGCTGWIFLKSKGLSIVFSSTIIQMHQFFDIQLSSQSKSHIHTGPLETTIALTRQTIVGKVMSLLLNMLSRLVITLFLRSKCLLISWLQSPSAVILEPPRNKVSHFFPI